MGRRFHDSIQPRMTAAWPGEARTVFDIDDTRCSGTFETGQRRQHMRPLNEPSECIDREGSRTLRTGELAAFDLISAGSCQSTHYVFDRYPRQDDRIWCASDAAYSAVVGSMTLRTWLILFAGKPPFCACSRMMSSFGAR